MMCALTRRFTVSEGGLEPPCPIRALAPQASASTYSATRTLGPPGRPGQRRNYSKLRARDLARFVPALEGLAVPKASSSRVTR
jgi:hypothetical protein